MKTTKQARRDAKLLFRNCFADGQLDENKARQFVRQVIELKPRGYVAILAHFQRLLKLEIERRTARIESAAPLPPDVQETVRNNLTRLYGPGLRFEFGHSPGLLGGMRVRVGSDVYDGSVQGRLEALEESFGRET